MTELLTAAQMRAIEQAAINSGEVTGLELMERVGQGVVEAIFEEWPEYKSAPQTACILCGPGNNGGDGFVVARLLKGHGWDVRVLLAGSSDCLPEDAKTNCQLWIAENCTKPLTEREFRVRPDTIIVDAIFGTGLTRPLEGEVEKVVTHLAGRNGDDYSSSLVSIDAPSGLCLDSGKPIAGFYQGLNKCERSFARITVSFDSPKAGHFLGAGTRLCGKVIVKDIGLINWRSFDLSQKHRKSVNPFKTSNDFATGAVRFPDLVLTSKEPMVKDRRHIFSMFSFAYWLSNLNKANSGSHKFSHGHSLIASGPGTKTGAARLAARAALRVGAGLVTIASPTNALQENASQITAIMLQEADTSAQLKSLLSDDRISSVCIGPGFARVNESGGLDFNHTREMVNTVLASHAPTSASNSPASTTKRAVVLDADALSAFQDDPSELFARLHVNCVLTPHEGEFKRLFPDIHAKLVAPATSGPAYSKVDATRDAAKRAGCTVLFKGPDTVIANPEARAAINSAQYERSAPWLATAGSGDVLAGFITGLLARGFAPMQAAETAAWLHVECALKFGPGLIAEDIPEQLPSVFRDLDL